MQIVMDFFSKVCTTLGLTISIKMMVMFTPLPSQPNVESIIFIKGKRLDVVDSFAYLSSTLSRDESFNSDISLMIKTSARPLER